MQQSLPKLEIGEYKIIPLVTPRMLKSESYLMRNCSREYICDCEQGIYLMFSVRDLTGKRIATLSFYYSSNYWRIDQCYGIANSEVLYKASVFLTEGGLEAEFEEETELYYVTSEVQRLLNIDTRQRAKNTKGC